MASDAVVPLAVIFGCISAVVALVDIPPFLWHVKQRNLAASSLVFWFILLNIMSVVNAILWPTRRPQDRFSGVGLCDVQVKILVASWNAVASTLAVIMRNLARLMDPDNAVPCPSPAQKRRALAIDLIFCWIIPLVLSGLHYIVQENRYYIDPGVGCNVSTDDSWPTVVLVFIWPAVFAMAAGYYAAMLLFRLHRYRRQFSAILRAHNTTQSRFNRLWQISLICIVWVLPQGIYQLVNNAWRSGHHAYSWSRVHNPQTWDSVVYYKDDVDITFDRWTRVGAGILIFVFFGMGHDAMCMYRRWLVKAGLGKLFPSLAREHQRPHAASTVNSSSSAASGAWSKAKSVFKKRPGDVKSDCETGLTLGSMDSGPMSAKSANSNSTKSNSMPTSPASPRMTPLQELRMPAPAATSANAGSGGQPYDGLPKKSVTASASGEPPSRSSTSQSERGSIFVTTALWQEIEPLRR